MKRLLESQMMDFLILLLWLLVVTTLLLSCRCSSSQLVLRFFTAVLGMTAMILSQVVSTNTSSLFANFNNSLSCESSNANATDGIHDLTF